jgi:hypothetical protein
MCSVTRPGSTTQNEIAAMWPLAQLKCRLETVLKSVGIGPVVAVLVTSAATSTFAQTVSRPTVVELFTSQGCSSCPSADALFEHYAQRPNVIALSYSVHYWDYLGWKDTLANPKFTDRQKAYSKARGDGQVYTPQIVVGGYNHAVGSDKAAIDMGIGQSQKRDAWVPVTLARSANGAVLDMPAMESWAKDATVWLATVSRRVEVAVKRGENAGRTLTYFNAVRSFNQVGRYDGKAQTLSFDGKAIDQSEADQVVVLVQTGVSGPIVGAATLAMK